MHFEILTGIFPTVFFAGEVVEQTLTPGHLVLNLGHISHDFLLFSNQSLVLLLQKLGLFLQIIDGVGQLLGLLLQSVSLFFQHGDFLLHGVDPSEDVSVCQLRFCPACECACCRGGLGDELQAPLVGVDELFEHVVLHLLVNLVSLQLLDLLREVRCHYALNLRPGQVLPCLG